MATDAVVRQVLRNLAYAGHRARTIRVQREAGSVWFSALIFRYPTESRYSPLCPAYFLVNDSARHPCGNHCYRIYYRIYKEAALANDW